MNEQVFSKEGHTPPTQTQTQTQTQTRTPKKRTLQRVTRKFIILCALVFFLAYNELLTWLKTDTHKEHCPFLLSLSSGTVRINLGNHLIRAESDPRLFPLVYLLFTITAVCKFSLFIHFHLLNFSPLMPSLKKKLHQICFLLP